MVWCPKKEGKGYYPIGKSWKKSSIFINGD
jgi:hypothetical protein